MRERLTQFFHQRGAGHVLGLFTAMVWGLTFVSTKTLLESFAPFEVLLSRFAVGLIFLFALRPHFLRVKRPLHEVLFAAAGLTGVLGYFILENTALTMATASNVSVVTSTAPLFIAIVATVLGRERALKPAFIVGFILAICGIAFISFTGAQGVGRVGWGELLALGGAVVWGFYSNILVYLKDQGYETVACVKHILAWGMLFMLLALPFMGVSWDFSRLLVWKNTGNILFLGMVASGICYVTWTAAVERLGASAAGAYIYLQPAFTIVAAMAFLGEVFTWRIGVGLVLVLAGLLLSEGRFGKKHTANVDEAAK